MSGLDAYNRGDYATALREWQPLAEQGDAGAQYNLGVMYMDGRGVPQDYAAATKWFHLAADQGNAGAQYNLGVMYVKGNGVPQTKRASEEEINAAAKAMVRRQHPGVTFLSDTKDDGVRGGLIFVASFVTLLIWLAA